MSQASFGNGLVGRAGFLARRVAARLGLLAMAGMVVVMSGDRVMSQLSGQIQGVDPLDVLDFQQLPNVLFVVDTSSTMGMPSTGAATDTSYWVGGDDVLSRLYQVKVAIRTAIKNAAGKANFGIGQYGPGNNRKRLNLTGVKAGGAVDVSKGPFIYVSVDAFNSVSSVNAGKSVAGRPVVESPILWDLFSRVFQPNLLNRPAGLISTPPSNLVVPTDYDWKDDANPAQLCPAKCLYKSSDKSTTCPTYCENEFLRSFIATENGFGTPYTTLPGVGTFANGNPLTDTRPATTGDRFYLKSRVFLNQVLLRWSTGPGNTPDGDAFTNANGFPAASVISRGLKEVLPLPGTDGDGDDQPACGVGAAAGGGGKGGGKGGKGGGGAATGGIGGLLGDDILDVNSDLSTRPCFQIEMMVGKTATATRKKRATFYLTSGGFGLVDKTEGCGPGVIANGILPCDHPKSADENPSLTFGSLKLELPIPTEPLPTGLAGTWPPTNYALTNPNIAGGIQLGGDGNANGNNTPIAATLTSARNYFNTSVFPSRPATAAGKQKNVIVLIVDGDENCGGDAVAAATALYNNAPVPDNRIETAVVYFPGTATAAANAVARAGSGGTRDAFSGGVLASELDAAVAAAIAAAASGTFSAADTTVTETVFEYVDPNVPTARYSLTQPVIFQPTFSMPNWKGHLKAYYNPGSPDVTTPRWPGTNDAGDKLLAQITIPAGGSTFSSLTGGATIATVAGSGAKIKRRIMTTSSNGIFVPTGGGGKFFDVPAIINRSAQAGVAGLWPPDSAVDPAEGTVGTLDGALGLPTSTAFVQATFDSLKANYGACAGGPFLAADDCLKSGQTSAMSAAIKEARQALLAYIAGAVIKGGTTPQRDASGNLLFVSRAWVLAETTLSAPAIVTGPLQSEPELHKNEYQLFRDGLRNTSGKAVNGINAGFGLRNPDADGDPASAATVALKPEMSLVLLGTNEGLHAFRAGPNCDQSGGACTETGAEELWSFIPFDQIGKISKRLLPFGRDPHPYMIASALRFGEVFVPHFAAGGFSTSVAGQTVTGAGVWRTLLVFGRGIGGKYYTALDVTAPGPYTANALSTNLPIVYWSRGNPDTTEGTVGGTKVNGDFDFDAFARMGETWSVPGLAYVDPKDMEKKISRLGNNASPCALTVVNPSNTARRPNPPGTEFVFYVGSGYGGANEQEGTTFYALDALNGDVLMASDVCDRSPLPIGSNGVAVQNALVSSPAVFSAKQLNTKFVGNSAGSKATRVYIGDVHGRLYKFNTSNSGIAVRADDLTVAPNGVSVGPQPVANPPALLNLDSDGKSLKPHVYVEAGNDLRFNATATYPFKMFGFRDESVDRSDTTPSTEFKELFTINFPVNSSVSPVNAFRGTAQPATAFNEADQGRVFYAGTKFKPAQEDCVATFDSIVFAVGAATGAAAYDFGISHIFSGEKAISVRVDRGKLFVDKGLSTDTVPQPPAAPAAVPGASGTGEVYATKGMTRSPVCH